MRVKKFGVKRAALCAILLVILLALVVAGFSLDHYYRDKAVPGTELAGVNVGGMTVESIKSEASALCAKIELAFEGEGKRITAGAEDLNISVDAEKTADRVISSGREENIFVKFLPYKKKEAPLVLTYDPDAIRSYLREAFPDMTADAVDAAVTYNAEGSVFEPVPGQAGRKIEIVALDGVLDDLAARPGSKTVEFVMADVPPAIGDEAAAQACDYANARLGVALRLVHEGKELHAVERGAVAAWFDFSPDENAGGITATVNAERIRDYVNGTVVSQIVREKIDRRVIRDGAGNELFVLNQGQTGQKVGNMDLVTEGFLSAVSDAADLSQEILLEEEAVETITEKEAHWVDVNLSNQTTTIYAGDTPIQTFVVSSGKASTPTVTGKYKVYRRNASMNLRGGSEANGDAYYYPDTRWITFFVGGYAFHTAYWHESFGTPVSHGCVNMREAEAKAIWDWAPIGTPVYVHY
ncbi:MAG: L,D-transpeptidase/peptidoglycan binding protein [Clostridiales Family XIII bacterium]|nr:L,D-transpeptidase/peptidoglycan binding protein [Clostridiales Family XIII bacterium]